MEYQDTREYLKKNLSDMLAVETHTLESIERQTSDRRIKANKNAHDILLKIERVLISHQSALEKCLSTFEGGVESTVKKTASAAIGALAGLYGKWLREDPVSRCLRDDYTALSLAAISYTMLHTTARGLGDTKVADMALSHLFDLTPLVVELSRSIPIVLTDELAAEGRILHPEEARKALEETQRAWSCEALGNC
ncbi:MAG: hypothetical protein HY900_33380 [Deltaproteobacteria bacterium]|nr:hypothetical protein [Deltaproteobacteria bacterium]